jgi:Flp pilus assembly protein TadD
LENRVPEVASTGAASSGEQPENEMEKARRLIADGMYEDADAVLSKLWLAEPANIEVISTYMLLMNECGRTEQAKKLKKLLQLMTGAEPPSGLAAIAEADDAYDDLEEEKHLPYAYFEAGFALIDARHFELAIMLLRKCNELQPNDPTVKYELGFALMALGKVPDAIKEFEDAYRISPDFDTVLNLSVCFALTRNLTKAKELTSRLSSLARDSDEIREVNHRKMVLKRLEGLSAKKKLSTQDWLYALYGGVLLSQKNHKQEAEAHKSIAEILLLLKGLLEGLSQEVEIIEYYNTQSRPLAKIFSELMELPMDSYKGSNRPEHCLLLMDWATDLIGPHDAFIDNQDNRIIFAYALTRSEPLPLVPDIVGYLVDEPVMPWDQKTREETLQTICMKILDKARDLEADPDILKLNQDLITYFEPKRRELVLKNPKIFLERPEYSAEIQST